MNELETANRADLIARIEQQQATEFRNRRAADTASSSTASPGAQSAAKAGDADGAASITERITERISGCNASGSRC